MGGCSYIPLLARVGWPNAVLELQDRVNLKALTLHRRVWWWQSVDALNSSRVFIQIHTRGLLGDARKKISLYEEQKLKERDLTMAA